MSKQKTDIVYLLVEIHGDYDDRCENPILSSFHLEKIETEKTKLEQQGKDLREFFDYKYEVYKKFEKENARPDRPKIEEYPRFPSDSRLISQEMRDHRKSVKDRNSVIDAAWNEECKLWSKRANEFTKFHCQEKFGNKFDDVYPENGNQMSSRFFTLSETLYEIQEVPFI